MKRARLSGKHFVEPVIRFINHKYDCDDDNNNFIIIIIAGKLFLIPSHSSRPLFAFLDLWNIIMFPLHC